ncbi:DUF2316 family protein [Weissella paramesenteroides]|uniref:DUF2316 family protein n=1 Tax=Weissella paramesenteroides TaxID=1249 RepID=UPI00223B4A5B|nr:DUF2316 family protein [Weissella paramesenteroides]MCT0485284.1 DUF2316 family protein [Weissella paramesenteroides]
MSLNFIERINTSKELRQNLKLSHLTIEHVAIDLNTSVQKINQILELDHVSPEDPWILKEYLSSKLRSQGIIGYPYSKLVGDFHDYWFLDTKKYPTSNYQNNDRQKWSYTQKIVHFLSIRSSFFVVFYVVNLTPACSRG